ncbi:MAG: hypothetical protein Q4E64_06415 [Phascolarctobacterium sp.]|nr:hypothetical protein [Phascolarctobacterium sp.]
MYGLLLAGACVLGSASSFAQEAPQILWDRQAIDGVEYREQTILAGQEELAAIGKMLDARLEYLRSVGKLPFKTLVIDGFQNNDVQSKMAQEDYIALVPVVTSDLHKSKVINYKNLNYYSYTVRAELNVLLCTYDGSNLKILYNLPLANQAVLGGSLEDALNEPLADDILKKQFVYNMEQLVEEVSFPEQLTKQLSDPYLPTYQVNNVELPDSVLQKFGDASELKAVLAGTFTNQYSAKYRDGIVLPSTLSGTEWKKAVVQHLTPSLNAGEYDPTQEAGGDVPIKIKVNDWKVDAGFASQYSIMLDVKSITDLEAYVGAKETKPLCKAQSVSTTRLPKDLAFNVQINWLEVFNDAALELGNSIKAK